MGKGGDSYIDESKKFQKQLAAIGFPVDKEAEAKPAGSNEVLSFMLSYDEGGAKPKAGSPTLMGAAVSVAQNVYQNVLGFVAARSASEGKGTGR